MKLDQKKEINRLLIYFFYDADGIVDRYVPYILEDMKKNCSEIFVVCNGKLTPEGRDTFRAITPNILVRENKGFDVWAYKTALDSYGWDKLSEFDEIVMMNHTIMGPLYPFSEVFNEMDKRNLDFWGLNKFHKHPGNPYKIVYGYIPEHIQSHFIAVRQTMIKSREFQKYWDKMPEITCYDEAVGKHEAIFTKHFADKGFRWEAYVDTSDLEGFTCYPLFECPVKTIQEYKSPVFKRRSFFHDYRGKLDTTAGRQGKELLEYIKTKTNYDVGLIWENLLRTCNMADIKENLNLNYVLPSRFSVTSSSGKKVALILHLYYDDLIEYCLNYAESMPSCSDIYITTDSHEKKLMIEEAIQKRNTQQAVVLEIENRGRDVSALLVAVAPILQNYDYVCFAHDKKVTQLKWGCSGFDFSERCFQNILGSRELVENIITLFEKDPYLGIIFPPPPNHAEYFSNVGHQWGPNFEITKKLSEKLKLHVPITEAREPVAPLGTMFWFRPNALRKLTEYGWKYSDFPKEPIDVDGTILHGIERIYPFVAQNAGYYAACVLSEDYAETELTNLEYMLRTIVVKNFHIFGYNTFHYLMVVMDYVMNDPKAVSQYKPSLKKIVKDRIRAIIPKPIWKFAKKIYRLFGGKKWLDETLCK